MRNKMQPMSNSTVCTRKRPLRFPRRPCARRKHEAINGAGYYNHERPHEGLGMEVPAKIYRRSRRRLPQNLKAWRYKEGWESRLVRGHGLISFNGRRRVVGEAFEGEREGLKQEQPGGWKDYFAPHLI